MPSVSIIIVTWNALPLLKQCLPSVVATAYDSFEIILADNASTDGSAEWVKETYPDVRVVTHPENWAFCKGNNEAIPHARGEYIVLLNNDVEVTAGWLAPLVESMQKAPEVGAVQPKLLQYTDRNRFEYAGGSGGFIDTFGYPFTRGRLFFTMEEDTGQYDDERDIFWATGAAVMFRKSALDEVGLLDEQFFMHMEEIDLCWRLKRRGYRIRVNPESKVYHIGGGSLPYGSTKKTYYNFRNSLLMLYKNTPASEWLRLFISRALIDTIAMARALLRGQFGELGAILKAYRDAHTMSQTYRAQRPNTVAPLARPSFKGSIVFQYFVKQRTRFQDLPEQKFISK